MFGRSDSVAIQRIAGAPPSGPRGIHEAAPVSRAGQDPPDPPATAPAGPGVAVRAWRTGAALLVPAALLAGAGVSRSAAEESAGARHLIYLHGRIVQEQQSARPRHPRFGHYELEKILETFRERGFVVTGGIRPKPATVDGSADRVVEQIRKLIDSGVSAGHITIVGASMGAGIALAASVKLQMPELRFAILGACLSENVRSLSRDRGRPPRGRILSIREASDDLTEPCADWKDEPGTAPLFEAKEIVIGTGLGHGFLYRPLPEWVEPVVQWADRPARVEGSRAP